MLGDVVGTRCHGGTKVALNANQGCHPKVLALPGPQGWADAAFSPFYWVGAYRATYDQQRTRSLWVILGAWGRYGFDDGNETCGACRDGSQSRKSKAANY